MKTISEVELMEVWNWINDKYPELKWGFRIIEDEPRVSMSVMYPTHGRAILRRVPNNWEKKTYALEYVSMRGELVGNNTSKQKGKGKEGRKQGSIPLSAHRALPGRKGNANVGSNGVPQK